MQLTRIKQAIRTNKEVIESLKKKPSTNERCVIVSTLERDNDIMGDYAELIKQLIGEVQARIFKSEKIDYANTTRNSK